MNFETTNEFFFRLPASIAILGSSRSGKTEFLTRFLTRLDEVCSDYLPVSKFILCFDTHQNQYDTIIEHMQNQFPGIEIKTYNNYPEEELDDNLFLKNKPGTMTIIVFDDVSEQIKPSFEKLLRKTGHHSNVSVFYLSQDSSGEPDIVKKALRSVNYVIIMRSSQPGIFLNDINKKYCPGNRHFLINCWEMASRKKSPFYPYLILDTTSIENKIRDGVFAEEEGRIYRL